MKTLPTANELKANFNDFANFTFELLRDIDQRPERLKFAAIAAQTAVELFLKYYYVRQGQAVKIQKMKNDVATSDFVDHTQILNCFYSENARPDSGVPSYAIKKELERLLDMRNSIVHRGQGSAWNAERAGEIVRCLYFIHCTAWYFFREPLFTGTDGLPIGIETSPIWRSGVEAFMSMLLQDWKTSPRTCLDCGCDSVVSGELFSFGFEGDEHLVCVTCFAVLDTFQQVTVIDCDECNTNNFYIDPLNCQGDQRYNGKCSRCDCVRFVRRCKECETFYHVLEDEAPGPGGHYFCSENCSKGFAEMVAFSSKKSSKRPGTM